MEAKAVADVQSLALGSPYLNLEPSVFVTRIPSPRPACAVLSENCASRGSLGARPGMRQTCVFLAHMEKPFRYTSPPLTEAEPNQLNAGRCGEGGRREGKEETTDVQYCVFRVPTVFAPSSSSPQAPGFQGGLAREDRAKSHL